MKTLQMFSDDYLENCRQMSPVEIVTFLDDFRRLHGKQAAASKLISMKVPEDLLNAFKTQSRLIGTPYQSQIKRLMRQWLEKETAQAS
ncbi:MAG: BrnA antitoxin family protein [Gammaproteobacteria bacterium]|nr:BrnA antitoxin family protein [Gammaproteobacteria bacterium]